MNFDGAMRAADRENEELGKDRYAKPLPGYRALEAITDTVLAYRPKSKQPKPKKRKKAKRGNSGASLRKR